MGEAIMLRGGAENLKNELTEQDNIIAQLTENLKGKAALDLSHFALKPVYFETTIPTTGWSATAPYKVTVQVEGMLESDRPIMDVLLSDNTTVAVLQEQEYSKVSSIDTYNGGITFYCNYETPTVEIPVQLGVIR